ncbi:MAG: glycerophosphodiester phosphodiesterase [Verrucomicrobiales bacterium]|nr:glycerophosphodiester phosphodiesterase [Verrucomicrobiales bacterium]
MKFSIVAVILILTISQAQAQEPLIVAHRGASKDAPENTLPAFNLAWQQGADAIEGDFHLTKDGHIVCIHDANTKKTAGVDLIVKDTTLEDLQKLDVGRSHEAKFKGTRMPTLRDVMATVPDGKKIYIEIKCGASIVPALLTEMKKSELKREQIVVISFKDEVIKAIEALAPHYKTCLLVSIKMDETGNLSPSFVSILTRLQTVQADGLSASFSHLTENLINSVKGEGCECHTWTVDDPIRALRLTEWGIQSITTNVPGYMRKHLFK